MKNNDIKSVLIKQIKAGPGSEYWDFEEYSIKDLNTIVLIEDSVLKNNGYLVPTQDDFSTKIQFIFNRIIDYNSSSLYLKVDLDSKCDFKLEYEPYYTELRYLYISKNNKFITYFLPLPYFIDYNKYFPEVSEYEMNPLIVTDEDGINREISRWKDIPDLAKQRYFNEQLLVNRNKYLFNDNKASFAWLKANDEYFLESLVTTFGYTKDKDLLAWVMKRNENKAEDFINENLFVKNCKGELEIREGILTYIEETINQGNYTYFNTLYSFYISHDKKNMGSV